MTIHFGPMLYAAQSDDDVWRFDVGMLVDDADTVSLEVDEGVISSPSATVVRSLGALTFVRFSVEVVRTAVDRAIEYEVTVAGESRKIDGVWIPPKGAWPRMMFFSCNGVDDPKRFLKLDDPHALWNGIYAAQCANDGKHHHVCIGGGDQIYCDSLFVSDPYLRNWRELPKPDRIRAEPTDVERARFLDGYIDLYTSRWWNKHTKCGEVFSRVPCAFTWDDHDIFDGWGSHEKALNESKVHRALFDQAHTCFQLFQRGGVSPAPSGHHLSKLQFGSLAVVLTDSRSLRTPTEVLGDVQHADLRRMLRSLEGVKQTIVVTSVPVIYRGFGVAESVLRLLPGAIELEDDLRDQWESPAHAAERRDFLTLLLEEAKKAAMRITIVSGDVHMGARGKCTSKKPTHLVANESETVIHQLTSSAIVFPPPSWVELAGLAIVDQKPRAVQTGVKTSLEDIAPPRLFLIERNWLSIALHADGDNKLKFQFMTERGPSTEVTVNSRPS